MSDVYIAAPYCARDVIQEQVVPAFERAGHRVTSGWLLSTREINEGSIGTSPDRPTSKVASAAIGDFDDLAQSDVVVAFTGKAVKALLTHDVPEEWLHTGGRHTEVGYALAKDIPVIIVGPPENVFQRTMTRHMDTWQGALDMVDYVNAELGRSYI